MSVQVCSWGYIIFVVCGIKLKKYLNALIKIKNKCKSMICDKNWQGQ